MNTSFIIYGDESSVSGFHDGEYRKLEPNLLFNLIKFSYPFTLRSNIHGSNVIGGIKKVVCYKLLKPEEIIISSLSTTVIQIEASIKSKTISSRDNKWILTHGTRGGEGRGAWGILVGAEERSTRERSSIGVFAIYINIGSRSMDYHQIPYDTHDDIPYMRSVFFSSPSIVDAHRHPQKCINNKDLHFPVFFFLCFVIFPAALTLSLYLLLTRKNILSFFI